MTQSSEIIGCTANPTDLFWLIFTKFRNDRDISGHFLGQAAATVAKALQSGTGPGVVHDLATLLYLASCEDCDLDSTVSEEIHDDTAVVTVVPNQNTSIRRQVHMRRIGRAWKVYFPAQI
ncbi:MAG: hypothetical protein GY715_08000 [Planctomycetes bacterium]|nr:hypothetical protein [Planctomycetota bacterium]